MTLRARTPCRAGLPAPSQAAAGHGGGSARGCHFPQQPRDHAARRLAPARPRRPRHGERGAPHGSHLCAGHHHAQPGAASDHHRTGECGRACSPLAPPPPARGTAACTTRLPPPSPAAGSGVQAAHRGRHPQGQQLHAADDAVPHRQHAARRGGARGGSGRGGLQALPRGGDHQLGCVPASRTRRRAGGPCLVRGSQHAGGGGTGSRRAAGVALPCCCAGDSRPCAHLILFAPPPPCLPRPAPPQTRGSPTL